MDNALISFEVHGEAKPAGSKIAQAIYHRGADGSTEPVMKDGRVVTVAREDNPMTTAWRRTVAAAAREVYQGPLLEGPLALDVTIFRPRPRSHYGSGKNADHIKDSSPPYPTTRPDTIKLVRAIEDALTSVLWEDDSQIVDHHLRKRYGDHAWVVIQVKRKVRMSFGRRGGEGSE